LEAPTFIEKRGAEPDHPLVAFSVEGAFRVARAGKLLLLEDVVTGQVRDVDLSRLQGADAGEILLRPELGMGGRGNISQFTRREEPAVADDEPLLAELVDEGDRPVEGEKLVYLLRSAQASGALP
jgi:hypothetical protein